MCQLPPKNAKYWKEKAKKSNSFCDANYLWKKPNFPNLAWKKPIWQPWCNNEWHEYWGQRIFPYCNVLDNAQCALHLEKTLEKDGTNKADRTYLTSKQVLSSFVSCYVDQSFAAKFVQVDVLVRTHRQWESKEYHPWNYSPMNLWIISIWKKNDGKRNPR